MAEIIIPILKNEGMRIEELEPIPAGDNPLEHDAYSMGQRIGTNCDILFDKHPGEGHARYVVVVDRTTGQRIRLTLASKPVPTGI